MDYKNNTVIRQWVSAVWNNGKCKFDHDIHIDELENNFLLKNKKKMVTLLSYFQKIQEIKKEKEIDLKVLLKIPLEDKKCPCRKNDLKCFDLFKEVDGISPPSFFLINTAHLDQINKKGREIQLEEISNNFQCLYFEYTQDGYPEFIYRHLYIYKKS